MDVTVALMTSYTWLNVRSIPIFPCGTPINAPVIHSATLDLHEDLWSLVQMSLQGNGLPRWPLANNDTGVMLGTSINIVIPEALRKGLAGFGEDEWIEFATDAMMGREALDFGSPPDVNTFTSLGFYPQDEVGRSVAWTQEQAIADYALGTFLQESGNTADGDVLVTRGHNWENLWDPSVGFIHGRNRDGSFGEFTNEDQWDGDYAEGNARPVVGTP